MSEEMVLISKKTLDFASRMAKVREERILTLESFVKDIAEHGFRHDTMPTVKLPRNNPEIALQAFYHDYLGSMDSCIRKRAREVLG